MMEPQGALPEQADDDFSDVYGTLTPSILPASSRRREFYPWHHPVKQIVRDRQWGVQTQRLLKDRGPSVNPLRYFTMPGPDLFDVRVLSEVCKDFGVQVEYFGFDSAGSFESSPGSTDGSLLPPTTAESALRQAGRVTPDSVVVRDRLEAIAIPTSQASNRLSQERDFDVVNLDACDHLAFCHPGRTENTFDALCRILAHQMTRRTPWLLFVTTRIDPDLFGAPGQTLKGAVAANLVASPDVFGQALADALEIAPVELESSLEETWSTQNLNFAKLYVIGLGKYLTQFFLGQPNLTAKVDLRSTYVYRVHATEPDMLALAFRISPENPPPLEPSTGGTTIELPSLEPARAAQIAQRTRTSSILDLDAVQDRHPQTFEGAVQGTLDLLKIGGYDTAAWFDWLADHGQRPINLNASDFSL